MLKASFNDDMHIELNQSMLFNCRINVKKSQFGNGQLFFPIEFVFKDIYFWNSGDPFPFIKVSWFLMDMERLYK